MRFRHLALASIAFLVIVAPASRARSVTSKARSVTSRAKRAPSKPAVATARPCPASPHVDAHLGDVSARFDLDSDGVQDLAVLNTDALRTTPGSISSRTPRVPVLRIALGDGRELSLDDWRGMTANASAAYLAKGPRQGDPQFLPGVFGFANPDFGGIGALPTTTVTLFRVEGCSLQQMSYLDKPLLLSSGHNAVMKIRYESQLRCFDGADRHVEYIGVSIGPLYRDGTYQGQVMTTTRRRVRLDGARLIEDAAMTSEELPQPDISKPIVFPGSPCLIGSAIQF